MKIGTTSMENSMVGSFYKINKELPHDPADTLLGIYPRENHNSKRNIHPMFITALFTIAKHGSNLNVH